MKLIDNASGNVSQGITLDSTNKVDRYKLSYNCSNIGSGKSFIRIYATVTEGYKTYFMPVQFNGKVEFELSIDTEATFLQFDVIGDASITGITFETVVDATLEYVKENSGYWDRIKEITNNTGKVRSDMLEGLINLTINAFANESGTITQKNGILTFLNGTTPEDSTEAVEITGGAIRVADSKLPNGEWNWTSAVNGRGINAATIIAETFAGLNITSVNIVSGTITGGTINGVTMKGSTIYSGDVEGGNYVEITSSGDINAYARGDGETTVRRTYSLIKRLEGRLYLGHDLNDTNEYRLELNSGEGATVMSKNSDLVLAKFTGASVRLTNGMVYIDGNVNINGSIYADNLA
ncbi:hypothetical protein QTL86_03530 [Cellulosilyticum sp. ST5]|uniref:hypothetical protein n=1 Tax=Cellulosilyticum sp. ST5 TaxID=3055805 RepID=UPI0039774732